MYETYYDYVREREQEAVLTALFKGVQDGGIRVMYAAKEANLSLNEFKDQMRLRGYTIPRRGKRTTATAK